MSDEVTRFIELLHGSKQRLVLLWGRRELDLKRSLHNLYVYYTHEGTKWQEKNRKLAALDILEGFFKNYINGRYASLRLEMKQLPPKEKRDAKDYLRELLIDEQFDELEDFVRERLSLFEETRRMVRNG